MGIAKGHMLLSEAIRILLIDEQILLREGLRLLLEHQADLRIVGEASKPADAIKLAGREQPDIILIDLLVEGDNKWTILQDLLAVAKEAHVIILTGVSDPLAYGKAIRLGARGIVQKREPSATLIKAIRKVKAGEVWLERSITASLLAELARATKSEKSDPEKVKIATLTRREREVVTLIAEGLKNKQIAKRLFISEVTVSHHLTSIFTKLAIANRQQLIVYAYQQGLACLAD